MSARASLSPESTGSQVELFHRVSGIVSSDLELDRMLDELVGIVVSVTGCDACLVYLLDEAAGEIVLRASQLPHDREIGHVRMKIGEGVTGWVAEHRAVVALSSGASSDPRFKPFTCLPEDNYEAFLSVPLVSSGEMIGVINVHHTGPHPHTPQEVSLLSYVAEQMGGAMVKAQLSEQSQSVARKFEMLAAVGETITTENYLDGILQNIAKMVAMTFEAPLCSIMVVDEDKPELLIKAVGSSSNLHVDEIPVRIENSLIGRVIRERQLLIVEGAAAENLHRYPELRRRDGLNSLLSAPLLTAHGVIGALNIYRKERKPFTDDEIGFAKVVAGQTALAVENARLVAETLEMKRLLEVRKVIERAKGILQRQGGLTEGDAYIHLRNESRRLRRPMRDLAEAIILAEELHRPNARRELEAR